MNWNFSSFVYIYLKAKRFNLMKGIYKSCKFRNNFILVKNLDSKNVLLYNKNILYLFRYKEKILLKLNYNKGIEITLKYAKRITAIYKNSAILCKSNNTYEKRILYTLNKNEDGIRKYYNNNKIKIIYYYSLYEIILLYENNLIKYKFNHYINELKLHIKPIYKKKLLINNLRSYLSI